MVLRSDMQQRFPRPFRRRAGGWRGGVFITETPGTDARRETAAMMPARIISSAMVLLLACTTVSAQTSQPAEAEHKDIGKVRTWSRSYDRALGAISEYVRSPGAMTECSGECYFISGAARHISWKCSPTTSCNLLCTVNPPAGSCSGGIQVPARR